MVAAHRKGMDGKGSSKFQTRFAPWLNLMLLLRSTATDLFPVMHCSCLDSPSDLSLPFGKRILYDYVWSLNSSCSGEHQKHGKTEVVLHSFGMLLWFLKSASVNFLCLRFCHRRQVFLHLFSCEAIECFWHAFVGLAVYSKQHPSPFETSKSGGNDTKSSTQSALGFLKSQKMRLRSCSIFSLSLCELKSPSVQDEESSGRHSRDVLSPSGWRYLD